MKNVGVWFFGLGFWLVSAVNCDAQTTKFHANPTIAFHEASKSKKDVLLLFCNRAEENCDVWLRYIQSTDASFLWHFLEVSVIYSDDFDGGVWAARYAVDETPLARLYPYPDGPYKSLTNPESLSQLYTDRSFPESGNEPKAEAPIANQTILHDTLDEAKNGGAVQKMLPEKNTENIVTENQETERPPEISKIEVPDLETVSPGFYRLETERMEAMGFTVQIANFNTFAELLHYAERIQHILELEVITEITRENDAVRYKVLLGHFPTREQAAELRTELQHMGIDGFVRKIE
jgi:hypothetical protein